MTKTYKTAAAILKHAPQLTDADAQELNTLFKKYCFYRDDRNMGSREFYCSACREHFFVPYLTRTTDAKHAEYIATGHNEAAHCPRCGTTALYKNISRIKSGAKLESWKRAMLIKPVQKNAVYLICYYVVKGYYPHSEQCEEERFLGLPDASVYAVYYLTPGGARKFKAQPDAPFFRKITEESFSEIKYAGEPFTKTFWYNVSYIDKMGYTVIGEERLRGTFLQYSQLEKFKERFPQMYCASTRYGSYNAGVIETPIVSYLCRYAETPSIEMMMKMGFCEPVYSLVYLKKPMKRFINWSGKTPAEIFNMTPAQFRELRNGYTDISDFRIYQLLKRHKGITYQDCTQLCSTYTQDIAQRIAKAIQKYNLNFHRTMKYIEKKAKDGTRGSLQATAELWTDYIRFAGELKYDLSRIDVALPKRLRQRHDDAAEAIVSQRDQKSFKKYKNRYEKLKRRFAYRDGKYEIVIPTGIEDIVAEGKALQHCVGGYANRHVNGQATILFLRRASKPTKRLVTIEVASADRNEFRIVQCRGINNRIPTEEEKAFIEQWKKWICAGSKRNKDNKAAVNAA